MPLNLVLIVIFMIVIPDLKTVLGKPQLKEGRAIGPILTLLQMSRNPLICLLEKPPFCPVLNETSQSDF